VQQSRIMRQMARTVRKRVLKELGQLAEKEPQKYADFWHEFGRSFKEGLATDPGAKDEILPYLRYASSGSEGELTSLEAYIERMPESQEEIYYVLGDDEQSVARSPHLDPFKARGIEVLYWVDPLDAFLAPMMQEFKEKKLRNIDDAGLELPQLEEEDVVDSAPILDEKPFNLFVGRCVTTLGERIVEVRESKVLKGSPVRLVTPEGVQDRDTQRLQRFLDQNYVVPKRIMEVNRGHPLISNLAHLLEEHPDSELINLSIEQLYESALVQEGLHPNPQHMLPRIEALMLLAAEAATNGKE
jgi:molecular chaperone HtpG